MKAYSFLLILVTLLIVGCKSQNSEPTSTPSRYYTDSIYSSELGEYRFHDVYLPKGFDPDRSYPIVYGTDGQMWQKDNYFKRAMDSLIDNDLVDPFILVGSHSNDAEVPGTTMQSEDGTTFSMQYRFFEYVRSEHGAEVHPSLENIYQKHMNYFVNELIPAVEKEFGSEKAAEERYFYGVSNGAAFGANLLTSYPALIGTYILFSTLGANLTDDMWQSVTQYPSLYLQYGDQEGEAFREEAEYLRDKYAELDQPCELSIYEGDHSETIWRVLFADRMTQLFTKGN